ncbi:hypothetical protein OAN59_11360 [Alphaproteobacteria bacterium]|nr:hypothetical protein [Alphaproteobacteria bacterium]
MKKNYFIIWIISILAVTWLPAKQVFAETYSCETDMSRYGRAGDTEITIFKRTGKTFTRIYNGGKSKFSILNENASQVTLAKMDENSIFVFLLSKKTREFTGKLLHLLDLKEVGLTNYGTCEIMD